MLACKIMQKGTGCSNIYAGLSNMQSDIGGSKINAGLSSHAII